MGKFANLAAVKTADSATFVYTPPEKAFGAARILVKPNLGYAVKPPATVSMHVLGGVLRGLRRAAPNARILIAEGVATEKSAAEVFEFHGVNDLLDEEMRLVDLDRVLMREYPNRLPAPRKYPTMTAPEYLEDFDCVISVGAFKKTISQGRAYISASLKNLYGFFPRNVYQRGTPYARGDLHEPSVEDVLTDVYFTIGQHIDGAVVDLTAKYVSPDERSDRSRGIAIRIGKVIWGDDMLAVDEAACRVAGEPVPEFITTLRQLRGQV